LWHRQGYVCFEILVLFLSGSDLDTMHGSDAVTIGDSYSVSIHDSETIHVFMMV
jgi:hypothetical protein